MNTHTHTFISLVVVVLLFMYKMFMFVCILQEWITAEHGTMAYHSHITYGSFGSFKSKYIHTYSTLLLQLYDYDYDYDCLFVYLFVRSVYYYCYCLFCSINNIISRICVKASIYYYYIIWYKSGFLLCCQCPLPRLIFLSLSPFCFFLCIPFDFNYCFFK